MERWVQKGEELVTDEQIGYFLGRIKGLSSGTKVYLRRSLGKLYGEVTPDLQLAVVYGVPDDIHPTDEQLQNLLFTAQVMCMAGDGFVEKPEKAVTQIIRDTERKRAASTDFSDSKMSELLSCSTGKHGDIYRVLGSILYGNKKNIDCFSLLKDLETWRYDSTKRKWASAYIKTRKDKDNE